MRFLALIVCVALAAGAAGCSSHAPAAPATLALPCRTLFGTDLTVEPPASAFNQEDDAEPPFHRHMDLTAVYLASSLVAQVHVEAIDAAPATLGNAGIAHARVDRVIRIAPWERHTVHVGSEILIAEKQGAGSILPQVASGLSAPVVFLTRSTEDARYFRTTLAPFGIWYVQGGRLHAALRGSVAAMKQLDGRSVASLCSTLPSAPRTSGEDRFATMLAEREGIESVDQRAQFERERQDNAWSLLLWLDAENAHVATPFPSVACHLILNSPVCINGVTLFKQLSSGAPSSK